MSLWVVCGLLVFLLTRTLLEDEAKVQVGANATCMHACMHACMHEPRKSMIAWARVNVGGNATCMHACMKEGRKEGMHE